jgi:hypothetical protein
MVSGAPDGRNMALVSAMWSRGAQQSASQTIAAADGSFAFRHLQPNSYRLTATLSSGGRHYRAAPVEMRVDGETTGVHLELSPGTELPGTIEVAEDPPGTPAEKRKVTLHATELGSSDRATSATVAPDGTFRVPDVFPEGYRVTIEPMPENGYLKALAVGGAALPPGAAIDLSRGVSHLKITLSRNGGQISGAITDRSGQILTATIAMVALIDDASHPENARTQRVGSDGRFTFKGLAPGKYRLLGVDLQSGPVDQEAMKKLVPGLEAFDVHEGDRVTRNVAALRKEDANAKP